MRYEDEQAYFERQWERNQRDQREDLAALHGVYDAPLRNPASVEWLARVTATSAVRDHLIATHDAATLPVADARLRRIAVACERYTLARLRGKYMLTVGRVFGRAA